MKKCFKSSLPLLVITIAFSCFQSCAPILKFSINKKYPPIDIVDKKIEAVCKSKETLEKIVKFDLEADVSQDLLNEISAAYLEKSNIFSATQMDELESIQILKCNVKMENQEIGIESTELFNLHNKYIRSVELEIFAATSPYFENDSLNLDPYFNRIKLKKIEFNKCIVFGNFKLLKNTLNSLLSDYLANINGQIKNYSIRIKPTPSGTKRMSEIVTSSMPIVIENDAEIDWKSYPINASILIDNFQLRAIASLSRKQMIDSLHCSPCVNCNKKQKQIFFEKKFLELKTLWENKSKENFDLVDTSRNYITVKTTTEFLANAFNETFEQFDFKYQYPVSFNAIVPNSKIKVGKPSIDCSCGHFCGGIGNVIARQACYFACYAGSLGRLSACLSARLALEAIYAPFGGSELPIGEFGGSLDGSGAIHGTFFSLVAGDGFNSISINHNHSFSGSINYKFDFNGLAGIGGLVCPHLFIHGNSEVRADIANPLFSTVSKLNDESSICKLAIVPQPTIINISLSESPALNIFTDFRNNLSCNLSLIGFGGFAWTLVSLIKNDQEAKNNIMAALTGKYNYQYQIKAIDISMKYELKVENKQKELKSIWGEKSLNAFLLKDNIIP